jgi:hydrogenase maturation protein HypF
MGTDIAAKRLAINGIVQGVGFRPFLFQLAEQHGLLGEVSNTATGVDLVIEGPPANLQAFIDEIPRRKPPLAHIVEITIIDRPPNGYGAFSIVKSSKSTSRATLISPDVTVCVDCLKEMFDPADRRFGYPFINCTNCGPRYTIIDDIPYDRPKTSMRHFAMCPRCQAEYDNPSDRRFHAQPNACPVCGPRVILLDRNGNKVRTSEEPIAAAVGLLKEGHILAVKGLGGFHLAVDATIDEAVRRLRRRKHREEKPLALMSPDLATIATFAVLDDACEALLTAIQRPIVLLPKQEPNPFSPAVAPRNHYFGVMLPYTPLHYLLLNHGFSALVMTSGNLSEEPIAIDNQDALHRLVDIADFFLVHDREIYLRSDDSIVRHATGETRFIRRSRGYVPVPIFLRRPVPKILACGAELKSTICLTRDTFAFVSQHIGDLENRATYDFFRLTIDHLKRILDIDPQIIACDLHPDYLSTRFAHEAAAADHHLQLVEVQHHHAHIAACMAEHKLDGGEPVIGLSFDGTGFGPDHAVWGGEVLIADYKGYQRAAHLAYHALPGGAAAIKQPWRMGLSHLLAAYGGEIPDLALPFLKGIDGAKRKIIAEMIAKGVNCPPTSSMGRLFDAVAAIAGLRQTVAFEGQAAMELEMAIGSQTDFSETDIYAYGLTAPDNGETGEPLAIETAPIIRGVAMDVDAGVSTAAIANRFHNTLVALFGEIGEALRSRHGIDRVVLSGGVFQNARLLAGLTKVLERRGFTVFSHRLVPPNDGGIALGQAMVAAARVIS